MRNIKATSEVPHHPSPGKKKVHCGERRPQLKSARRSASVRYFREKIVKAEDLTQMLYPRSKFSNVEDKIKQYIGVRDTPFWRDAPLHHMLDMNTDLDGAMTAWMSEPAFTKTSYIGSHAYQKIQNKLE
ncbi:hypothetical protein NECAME_07525 [Necator americanus]|uniref:Uncharacterized protein n=1 Tax=Necator americanus TaxID=51031 RepID=W2TM21_NECAM|nr:hypothetical protein NECAME_07525 [Necator americanus]ETN83165.1 hypothetical protein NECAME_07525 [Necator americanus]